MAKITLMIKQWLASKTESCKSVAPLFSDSLERELSFYERLRLRLHLFTCSACLNYVSNLKFMQDVFKLQDEKFTEEHVHVPLSADARDRIKTAIRTSKNIILFAVSLNLLLI